MQTAEKVVSLNSLIGENGYAIHTPRDWEKMLVQAESSGMVVNVVKISDQITTFETRTGIAYIARKCYKASSGEPYINVAPSDD